MDTKPITILFRNGDLIITKHALDRFKNYWLELDPQPPTNYLKTLGRLLAAARPQSLDRPHSVLRIIKHNFTKAEYLVNLGWRFVIVDNGGRLTLVTVERIVK